MTHSAGRCIYINPGEALKERDDTNTKPQQTAPATKHRCVVLNFLLEKSCFFSDCPRIARFILRFMCHVSHFGSRARAALNVAVVEECSFKQSNYGNYIFLLMVFTTWHRTVLVFPEGGRADPEFAMAGGRGL